MSVLIFSTTFVWNIPDSKNKWASYDQMHVSLHVKYHLFLSDFNETWIIATEFRKILQMSNFFKIRSVGTELLHADGQTWRN
jgi:hypothetical protein